MDGRPRLPFISATDVSFFTTEKVWLKWQRPIHTQPLKPAPTDASRGLTSRLRIGSNNVGPPEHPRARMQ